MTASARYFAFFPFVIVNDFSRGQGYLFGRVRGHSAPLLHGSPLSARRGLRMELELRGSAQCAVKTCSQLDFLPFTCDKCSQKSALWKLKLQSTYVQSPMF